MNLLILVVDDESDVEVLFRQQFRGDLRAGRFTMEFAQSAQAALQCISDAGDASLILILSDINMPIMDGLEFLRQIRAQNLAQGVPVVMITTESSEEHVKQAIQSGAQGYIRKPFTAEQVKERVLPLVRAA